MRKGKIEDCLLEEKKWNPEQGITSKPIKKSQMIVWLILLLNKWGCWLNSQMAQWLKSSLKAWMLWVQTLIMSIFFYNHSKKTSQWSWKKTIHKRIISQTLTSIWPHASSISKMEKGSAVCVWERERERDIESHNPFSLQPFWMRMD